MMMALGLNIVVGYAGLLDLGYVAFYAIGAYTAAWFASPHFGESVDVQHFGAVGVNPDAAGIHISIWLIAHRRRRSLTAVIGVLIGLPTLRLRGDYLAIVTLGFGEIMPQIAAQRRRPLRHRLQPHERRRRGSTRSTRPASATRSTDWLGLPGDYLTAENGIDCFFWTALVARAVHRLLLVRLRDSRLGPGLDRDPRGRDRGRRDGRAADAHEDLGLRRRRVLRRRSPAPTTRASRARRSRTTSSSTSRSSSSAWSSSAGWATSGA